VREISGWWREGFAWGSLFWGTPPVFCEEWESGLECWGCERGDLNSGEVVEGAGDAGGRDAGLFELGE
jgi:hypothetical protein